MKTPHANDGLNPVYWHKLTSINNYMKVLLELMLRAPHHLIKLTTQVTLNPAPPHSLAIMQLGPSYSPLCSQPASHTPGMASKAATNSSSRGSRLPAQQHMQEQSGGTSTVQATQGRSAACPVQLWWGCLTKFRRRSPWLWWHHQTMPAVSGVCHQHQPALPWRESTSALVLGHLGECIH